MQGRRLSFILEGKLLHKCVQERSELGFCIQLQDNIDQLFVKKNPRKTEARRLI
jgi:hypothetical protein